MTRSFWYRDGFTEFLEKNRAGNALGGLGVETKTRVMLCLWDTRVINQLPSIASQIDVNAPGAAAPF